MIFFFVVDIVKNDGCLQEKPQDVGQFGFRFPSASVGSWAQPGSELQLVVLTDLPRARMSKAAEVANNGAANDKTTQRLLRLARNVIKRQ